MATAPQEMKVKTLEVEMLAVEVVPTNTVKKLRAMLLESKRCEDAIERQLLRVEVVTAGLLIDDDQTVEPAGLLCAESDVTIVYARREVEAATKEAIHEEGLLHRGHRAVPYYGNCYCSVRKMPASSVGDNPRVRDIHW